ncbi:MAG: hypothetical protein ABW161_15180, partial [Candidatus Thiodiazotropha sp.]
GAQGANRLRFTDRFERFTTKAPGFAGGYLLYAGQLLYGNWINPGIDSVNDFLRVMFILFVIYRFSHGILQKVKGSAEE